MANQQRGSFQLLANQTSSVLASNYAIKRDLRENISFKFIIGRVGPLFWLLGVMKNLLGFLKAKASFPPEHKVELFARGERFRFSRGAESFEGICFLDYYRDEWSRLTLMADSIHQIIPTNLAPLTHQQQDAIAVEAMHLLQLTNGKTKVGVARSDT